MPTTAIYFSYFLRKTLDFMPITAYNGTMIGGEHYKIFVSCRDCKEMEDLRAYCPQLLCTGTDSGCLSHRKDLEHS